MTNVEKAQKEIKEWIEYYENQVKTVKKCEEGLMEIAKLLDELEVETDSRSYNYFEIGTKSVEESRALLSKILAKTDIKNFVKISSQFENGLRWSYSVNFKEVDLRVFPAEPNKDCVAVERVHTYTSWVCENRK
jgi:hypothetical protein